MKRLSELIAELARERKDLGKAEQDIADGDIRIGRQAALADRLRDSGQGAGRADRLLQTFRQTQRAWFDHRDLILARIAYLEGGLDRSLRGGDPAPADRPRLTPRSYRIRVRLRRGGGSSG